MLFPRRGRFLFSVGLLVGCGTTDVELLSPRRDAGSPVVPSSPEGGISPTDAGDDPVTDDAGSSACPADALLCEGFESESNLDGWTFHRSDGMATATTLDSHSGMGSLELSTRAAGPGAYAYLARRLTPVSSGSLYLRAFLKVPGDQAVADYDVVLLSNAEADAGVVVSFAGAGMSLSNAAGGAVAQGAQAFPRAAWVCLQLALPSAASSVTTDLNGVRDATLLIDDVFPAGGYGRVAIGVVRASLTQAPTSILIDDVVIAPSPIGCEWDG